MRIEVGSKVVGLMTVEIVMTSYTSTWARSLYLSS